MKKVKRITKIKPKIREVSEIEKVVEQKDKGVEEFFDKVPLSAESEESRGESLEEQAVEAPVSQSVFTPTESIQARQRTAEEEPRSSAYSTGGVESRENERDYNPYGEDMAADAAVGMRRNVIRDFEHEELAGGESTSRRNFSEAGVSRSNEKKYQSVEDKSVEMVKRRRRMF